MKKVTLFFLVIGLLFFSLRAAGNIPPADAVRLVKEGAKLVDVRTPAEYAAGHIEGAINLPLSTIESRAGELGDQSKPIILYCRSGNRSGRAAKLLQRLGFSAVHNLGGMSSWPKGARP